MPRYKKLTIKEIEKKIDWKNSEKLMKQRMCLNCGKKLKLVKGEMHSWFCECSPKTLISIG